MDIQHAAVVWRLLFGHISALNNQNWISFLVFARRICIYCMGALLAWVFEGFLGKSGRGGASGRAWKRIVPPANQGIEPPRFYPTY